MTHISRMLMVSTDVAHIVIFHPDDLHHAAEWPIAWYSEPFVFPVESRAGRLVAWCTGGDGGFKIRVTTGALTERERLYAGPQWTFPYTVRHGRVHFDNTDALPGKEKMTDAADQPDCWVDLPNGDYAVTVTAIEWSAEPGDREEGAETLPNYVVSFLALVDEPAAPARRPPDLECQRDAVATDELCDTHRDEPGAIDFDRPYPAFVSTNVARPGQSFNSQGEAPIEAAVAPDAGKFVLFDTPVVAAASLAAGSLAVVAVCHGSGGVPGQAKRYSFRARRTVRIVAQDGMFAAGQFSKLGKEGFFRRRTKPVPVDALAAVTIEPYTPAADVPMTVDPATLKAAVLAQLADDGALAKRIGGVATYESLRIAASDDPDFLSNWLLDNLPLPAEERLAISVLPINARMATLMSHIPSRSTAPL